MLIDQIKKDNMLALKDKDSVKRGVLSIVINKWMVLSTDVKVKEKGGLTDLDLISIIQKTLKELVEEKEGYLKVNNDIKAQEIDHQIESINVYLPKMLSREEIKDIILGLDDKSVPAVMKYFKQNYAGKVDNGLVLQVTKEIIA